jgi:hypothetical protein
LLAGRKERTTPLSTGSYQDILGRALIQLVYLYYKLLVGLYYSKLLVCIVLD